MPPKSNKPAVEAEVEAAAPEAAEPIADDAAPLADEAPAEDAVDEIDSALVKINAAVRPMKAADGSEGGCDLYKSDKAGNILVPASDVAAMLEHGFVLVDEDA